MAVVSQLEFYFQKWQHTFILLTYYTLLILLSSILCVLCRLCVDLFSEALQILCCINNICCIGELAVPCKMSSGSVRVSFRPPLGTRHNLILASSPASVDKRRDKHVKSHTTALKREKTEEHMLPQLSTTVYLLTYSKLVCVKWVPREVRHIDRILDGGQGCVW